jgi:hypothetical protein
MSKRRRLQDSGWTRSVQSKLAPVVYYDEEMAALLVACAAYKRATRVVDEEDVKTVEDSLLFSSTTICACISNTKFIKLLGVEAVWEKRTKHTRVLEYIQESGTQVQELADMCGSNDISKLEYYLRDHTDMSGADQVVLAREILRKNSFASVTSRYLVEAKAPPKRQLFQQFYSRDVLDDFSLVESMFFPAVWFVLQDQMTGHHLGLNARFPNVISSIILGYTEFMPHQTLLYDGTDTDVARFHHVLDVMRCNVDLDPESLIPLCAYLSFDDSVIKWKARVSYLRPVLDFIARVTETDPVTLRALR